jgi:multiple sugar transport system ATP-binding protein
VFLMDEPLSNLDAKLRLATRSQIAALQRRLGITTVYVTHDQVEAMTMGDRVAVLRDGVLQQVDMPSVLYDSPANAFVAGFIGAPAMNLVRGTVGSEGVTIGAAVVQLQRGLKEAAGTGKVTVGVRPESVDLVGQGAGVPAIVNLVEELGAEAYVYARLEHDEAEAPEFVIRVEPKSAPPTGSRIALHLRPHAIQLFDAVTGARITEE